MTHIDVLTKLTGGIDRMSTPTSMPDHVSNAILLLWISLAMSVAVFLWKALAYHYNLETVINFAIDACLRAFPIIFLSTRNNIARLLIIAVAAWNVLQVVFQLGSPITLLGLIVIAHVAISAFACFRLFQSNDWFGSLTNFSR
jgi:hypothetical protein